MTDRALHAAETVEQRVANSLRQGSPTIGAGRIDDLSTEQAIAGQLVREAQAAYRSWAHWKAINDRMGSQELIDTLCDYTDDGIRAIRNALTRDAILQAFRLSDPPDSNMTGTERITLCRAARLLDEASVRNRVTGRDWVVELGYPSMMLEAAVEENARRVDRIRESVVANWQKGDPSNRRFNTLREVLRPVRHRLAHASIGEEIQSPIIDEITEFIETTLRLATDYALLMTGKSVEADDAKQHRQREAEKFWNFAFDSMLASAKRDQQAADCN